MPCGVNLVESHILRSIFFSLLFRIQPTWPQRCIPSANTACGFLGFRLARPSLADESICESKAGTLLHRRLLTKDGISPRISPNAMPKSTCQEQLVKENVTTLDESSGSDQVASAQVPVNDEEFDKDHDTPGNSYPARRHYSIRRPDWP